MRLPLEQFFFDLSFAVDLFERFIWRDLRKSWARLLLTVFGIALGVAVLLAISLANQTVILNFKGTIDQIAGKTNLELRPKVANDLDERILADLSWIWHFDGKMTPLIDENVSFPDQPHEPVQFLGIDMLSDPEFNSSGSANQGPLDKNIDFALLKPGKVLIGAKLAQRHKLVPGKSFQILAANQLKTCEVARVIPATGLGGAYSGNVIVADIAFAQDLLAMSGRISEVELIIPLAYLNQVKQRLSNVIPPEVSVSTPSQRGEQVEKITRSFETNLLALSVVALMVGMFLIFNTMAIAVLRRRQEIAILRALGISRLVVAALFAMEALTFGVVGSAIGTCFGLVMSNFALAAISETVQYFYFRQPIESVTYDPVMSGRVFVAGLLFTFLASLPPILEAVQIQPGQATKSHSYELKVFLFAKPLAVVGIVLFGLAYLAALAPALEKFPVFGYLAALLSILGTACILPAVLQFLLPRLGGWLQALRQPEGRLAALSLYGILSRTSTAVASLTVGIAMMVSLAIMISSFRDTVNLWIDQTLRADLWLQPTQRANGDQDVKMPEAVADKLVRLPGIKAVDAFVEIPLQFRGERTNLAGANFDVIAQCGHMRFVSGESVTAVCKRMKGNAAVVSETFANRNNTSQGDEITIDTPSGPTRLRIEGVYYDYSSELGYIVIDRVLYKRLFRRSEISNCAIYLRPEFDPARARAAILQCLQGKPLVRIQTTGELKREAIKIFDRTFAITYALHTIAIFVAVLSVMNALFALAIESKREFGILRYLGATASQLRTLVLYEAFLLAILGNLGGLVLGYILSLILIYVINKQSFGWSIQVSMPVEFLVESSALVIAAALSSAIVPARMAMRTLPPQAVRDE